MLPHVAEVPIQDTEDSETLTDRQASMRVKYNSRLPVKGHDSIEGLQPGKEVFYQANPNQNTRDLQHT